MIVGLLVVGSVIGGIAATISLLFGQPISTAALIYVTTGALSVILISMGCAFRPRKSSIEQRVTDEPTSTSS